MLESIVNLIIPPLCPLCRDQVKTKSSDRLCFSCENDINYIEGQTCKVCSIQLLGDAEDVTTCGACQSRIIHFEKNISLFNYHNKKQSKSGLAEELIKRYKYSKDFGLKTPLESLYNTALDKALKNIKDKIDLVMAVPLHKKKLIERGFNQSLAPIYKGAKKHNLKIDIKSLTRVKYTSEQAGLKYKERVKNIKDAFAVINGENIEGKNILLVDDVYTTGTTVNECARVLKKYCSKVYVLTLARTMLS